MYWVLSLLLFIFLGVCSGDYLDHTGRSDHQAVQEREDQRVISAINRKLKESAYSYRLTVKQSGQVRAFTGQQQGENWMIQESEKKLKMERKGNHILIHVAGKEEEMTAKQAGVISPRDHLQLIKEIAKSYHPVNGGAFNVEIDQHKWLEKLKERLYLEEETPLFALSEKMQVNYRLLLAQNGTKLKKITLTIKGYDPDQARSWRRWS